MCEMLRILMKNIGVMAPRVELENMGPFVNFTLRRQVLASNDLFKKACAKPKTQVSFRFSLS